MTLMTPLFTQDQSYSAWMLRRERASLYSPGVSVGSDLLVTTTGGLQVSIAAGSAYIQQTVEATEPSAADNGLYYTYNDSVANPYNTISAPITNPRIDQVILRVYDIVEQGLSGASFARFEWLPGSETAGANVTPGSGGYLAGVTSLSVNSLRLAYVLQTVGEVSISSANILNVAPSLLIGTGAWVALTSASGGFLSAAFGRRRGDAVELKGRFTVLSGAMAAGAVFCNLPAALVPATSPQVSVASIGGQNGTILVGSTLTYQGPPTVTASNALFLDGVSYAVS